MTARITIPPAGSGTAPAAERGGCKGWIRCFWGGIAGAGASPTRIIPDVCADLIYHIDETAGRIIQASFCGVSDVCGTAHLPMIPGHTVSTFAIRFHAFGAYAFADDALRGTLNGFESPEVRFGRLDRALRARLPELRGLSARTAYAQSVLLAFQCRENPLVETAADALLYHRGTATVSEWAHELFISSRQLERLWASTGACRRRREVRWCGIRRSIRRFAAGH